MNENVECKHTFVGELGKFEVLRHGCVYIPLVMSRLRLHLHVCLSCNASEMAALSITCISLLDFLALR